MGIIESLNLTPEEVEKIVAEYCENTVKNRLAEIESLTIPSQKRSLAAKILAFIATSPDKQRKQSEITFKFAQTPRVKRLAALEELLKSGEVKAKIIEAEFGRPATVYYIP